MDHLNIRTGEEDGEIFLFHIFLVLCFDFGARDIFVCLCSIDGDIYLGVDTHLQKIQ